MVSGGGFGGGGCGGCGESPTLRLRSGQASHKRREKWGTHNLAALAKNDSKICCDRNCQSRALARLQRGRLSESLGVRAGALLGEGDRAENGDGESCERKSVRCRIVFSKGGGTGCGTVELGRTAMAGAGSRGKPGGRIRRARPCRVAAVGAASVLRAVGSAWQRADFRANVVAVF